MPSIARMTVHFKNLLESACFGSGQRLSGLSLLTDVERHELLIEWNDTEIDYPRDTCLHQLFETQVRRTPDAVAAVFQNEQITYRKLNQRVNQLANYLINSGVAGCINRYLCRAVSGYAHGIAGHIKSRGGICSHGSVISSGPTRLYAGRCRGFNSCHSGKSFAYFSPIQRRGLMP